MQRAGLNTTMEVDRSSFCGVDEWKQALNTELESIRCVEVNGYFRIKEEIENLFESETCVKVKP